MEEEDYPQPGGEAGIEQMKAAAAYNEQAKEKFLAWKRDQWHHASCPMGAIPVSELDKQLEEWKGVCRVNEEAPEVEEAVRTLWGLRVWEQEIAQWGWGKWLVTATHIQGHEYVFQRAQFTATPTCLSAQQRIWFQFCIRCYQSREEEEVAALEEKLEEYRSRESQAIRDLDDAKASAAAAEEDINEAELVILRSEWQVEFDLLHTYSGAILKKSSARRSTRSP